MPRLACTQKRSAIRRACTGRICRHPYPRILSLCPDRIFLSATYCMLCLPPLDPGSRLLTDDRRTHSPTTSYQLFNRSDSWRCCWGCVSDIDRTHRTGQDPLPDQVRLPATLASIPLSKTHFSEHLGIPKTCSSFFLLM